MTNAQMDPTLVAGVLPTSHVSPEVEQFLSQRETLTPQQQKEGYQQARKEAQLDGSSNKVVMELGGKNYWGKEYPNLFSFDGELRGNYENWAEVTPDNESTPQISAQLIKGPGGESTHVFFETDDGHMYAIRRTAGTMGEKNASKQEFEVISTTTHMGQGSGEIVTRKISSEQLKGIFARPGEPLVLGNDPETGKAVQTRGNIRRITSMRKSESGKVAPSHRILSDPEKHRDTPGKFMEAVRQAQQMEAASKVGPLAITEHFPHESDVSEEKETSLSEQSVLTPEQQSAKRLQQLAEMGADLLQSEGKTATDARMQASDFKARTTSHIRSMHQQAAAEGRTLTDKEIRYVQGLQDSVKKLDTVALVMQARET